MAVAGLACLPVFLLYLVLQRHIVNAYFPAPSCMRVNGSSTRCTGRYGRTVRSGLK
jgi:hypothetical protein